MDKEFILSELKRVAAENGAALGSERFAQETGIQRTDWLGKHWARWGDAVREAGLEPNKMNVALPEAFLLEKYAELTAELGRIPTKEEVRLKARRAHGFPSHNTFERLGRKTQRLHKLAAYCREQGNREDVLALCEAAIADPGPAHDDGRAEEVLGFVYLLKSGKFYKLGKTNCIGRRERDLAIQLPEKSNTVHAIRTDDPTGIEAYWHKRFEAKRMNGEWFGLSADDVRAFRRRKFM